jgi:hypothetical protein
MAAMRVEDRDGAPLERLPLDGAVESVEALRPAASERTPHDRGVLVKSGAEHRRHRQDNMPIDDAFVEHPADLADPVVHGDFGAAQAQGGFAAQRHHGLPLPTVQTAVFHVPDLHRGATGEPLANQTRVIGGLVCDHRVAARGSHSRKRLPSGESAVTGTMPTLSKPSARAF